MYLGTFTKLKTKDLFLGKIFTFEIVSWFDLESMQIMSVVVNMFKNTKGIQK